MLKQVFECPYYMFYNHSRLLEIFDNIWSKFKSQTLKEVKVATKLSMLSLTTLTTFCCNQATF